MPGQRFQFTFSGHSNWVRSCCFSPDGRLAVSGSDDKTVRIWDVATRQCIRVYDDHSGYVNTVAFHPDGTCVASAGTDNAIKVRCNGLCPGRFCTLIPHIAYCRAFKHLVCSEKESPKGWNGT